MGLISGTALCAKLWLLGVRESLQLQRFVVLLALDDDGKLWALVKSCVILHGCVFLGSLGGWWHVVRPTLQWVLGYPAADVTNTNTSGQCATTVDVVAGGQSDSCGFQWTPGLQQSLDTLFYALWVTPAYLIALFVSCSLYNDAAERAVAVRAQHTARIRAAEHLSAVQPSDAPPPTPNMRTGGGEMASSNSGGSPFVGVAQEVYRATLFLVTYVEAWLLGLLPIIGRPLALLLCCWLYAFYCFEYTWALRGMRVQDRLAVFEGAAPFFAGYGTILAATTMLPFYAGGAVMALAFLVFVLVACDSEVTISGMRQHEPAGTAAAAPGDAVLRDALAHGWRVPVFGLAAWPTRLLLTALFPASAVKPR